MSKAPKRVIKIQNLIIKGTIKEYKDERNKLVDLLEKVANFAIMQYDKQNISGNIKVYHRINRGEGKFIILIIKEKAKHNPYYAIFDMNAITPEERLNYSTDIKTLLPLLGESRELLFKQQIISCFTKQYSKDLTLIEEDKEIEDYIEQYDKEYEENY